MLLCNTVLFICLCLGGFVYIEVLLREEAHLIDDASDDNCVGRQTYLDAVTNEG